MAICSNGIFGPISGTLGGMVYSSWNGVQCVRLKNVKYTNTNSPGQVDQRAKFKAAIQFLKPLKDILSIGFKAQALKKKMAPFNMAMAYTLANSLSGSGAQYTIDYPNVRISRGSLKEAADPAVSIVSPLKIEFTWKDSREAMFNDSVILAVYNPAKKEAAIIYRGNYRTAEKQAITVPSTFEGDEVHCYLAFQNARGTETSESQYLGSLRV